MNASASRCVLLTLKLTMDLNACGFEGCPARVTNSISPLSYRTLRPWCSVPWAHPLDPSSRLQRENPGIGKRVPQPKPIKPPSQSEAIINKTPAFSTASTHLGHQRPFFMRCKTPPNMAGYECRRGGTKNHEAAGFLWTGNCRHNLSMASSDFGSGIGKASDHRISGRSNSGNVGCMEWCICRAP